jgi:hypothetical protein
MSASRSNLQPQVQYMYVVSRQFDSDLPTQPLFDYIYCILLYVGTQTTSIRVFYGLGYEQSSSYARLIKCLRIRDDDIKVELSSITLNSRIASRSCFHLVS